MTKSHVGSIYLQTTPVTCGVAVAMMILHRLRGIDLSPRVELDLFRQLKMENHDIVPAMRLATHLQQQRLKVLVVHDHPDKFWSVIERFGEQFVAEQRSAYAEARVAGVVVEHKAVSLDDVQSLLAHGHLIIYGIELPGGVKHAVFLDANAGDAFHGVDPLSGAKSFRRKDLWKIGNLNTGRWYISVTISRGGQNEHNAG